jgi:malate synthase
MQNISNSLLVDTRLCSFVHSELLQGLPLPPSAFWQLLESTLESFAGSNASLLARREELQLKIDAFHVIHRQSASVSDDDYISFLKSIGYIEPPAPPFSLTSHQTGLDAEIDTVCGPQIVVPVTRARFALNAANSRWGSLYDVLYAARLPAHKKCNIPHSYGTDAMLSPFFAAAPPPPLPPSGFSDARALHVISVAKGLLDRYFLDLTAAFFVTFCQIRSA